MIAGWLRDRGYSVEIIDQEALGCSPEQVAGRVDTLQPRLVAIIVSGHQPSASTQQMVGAQAVAKALPADITTVMIGNHPSALPERTLREGSIHIVCDGEGPLTIEGLLKRRATPANVPGLVYMRGASKFDTGRRD